MDFLFNSVVDVPGKGKRTFAPENGTFAPRIYKISLHHGEFLTQLVENLTRKMAATLAKMSTTMSTRMSKT